MHFYLKVYSNKFNYFELVEFQHPVIGSESLAGNLSLKEPELV